MVLILINNRDSTHKPCRDDTQLSAPVGYDYISTAKRHGHEVSVKHKAFYPLRLPDKREASPTLPLTGAPVFRCPCVIYRRRKSSRISPVTTRVSKAGAKAENGSLPATALASPENAPGSPVLRAPTSPGYVTVPDWWTGRDLNGSE